MVNQSVLDSSVDLEQLKDIEELTPDMDRTISEKVETFLDNSKLDGLYLLGFHSQSQDLKEMKKENSEENLKESEEEE